MSEQQPQKSSDSTNLDEQIENLSHEELMEISQSALKRILATDSLLADLPGDVTVDEVLSQIAVAHGQSITVTLLRHTEKPLPVVVSKTKVAQRKSEVMLNGCCCGVVRSNGLSSNRTVFPKIFRSQYL